MTDDEIAEFIASVEGCNANVCFALTGSSRLTAGNFGNQQRFVLAMGDILASNPAEFAAAQFGLITRPLVNLTPNRFEFTEAIAGAEFVDEDFTRAGGAVLWCSNQLRFRPDEANKIVLFTDGRDNLGGSPAFFAKRFRRTGGEVCVVGVGPNENENRLLNIVGGDESKVLRPASFEALFDILADLVHQVCGTELI